MAVDRPLTRAFAYPRPYTRPEDKAAESNLSLRSLALTAGPAAMSGGGMRSMLPQRHPANGCSPSLGFLLIRKEV